MVYKPSGGDYSYAYTFPEEGRLAASLGMLRVVEHDILANAEFHSRETDEDEEGE